MLLKCRTIQSVRGVDPREGTLFQYHPDRWVSQKTNTLEASALLGACWRVGVIGVDLHGSLPIICMPPPEALLVYMHKQAFCQCGWKKLVTLSLVRGKKDTSLLRVRQGNRTQLKLTDSAEMVTQHVSACANKP